MAPAVGGEPYWVAVHDNVAGGGRFQEVDAAQEGALARTRAADQGHDVAFAGFQRNTFEYFKLIKGFVNIPADQRRLVRHGWLLRLSFKGACFTDCGGGNQYPVHWARLPPHPFAGCHCGATGDQCKRFAILNCRHGPAGRRIRRPVAAGSAYCPAFPYPSWPR